jgi:hypothetical protein
LLLKLSMLLADCLSCANYMILLGDPRGFAEGFRHPTGRKY